VIATLLLVVQTTGQASEDRILICRRPDGIKAGEKGIIKDGQEFRRSAQCGGNEMFLRSSAILFLVLTAAYASPPKVGERAPDFSLPTAAGSTIALKDFAGKSKVVLVFYRGYW
jgi:hypothetical protein